MAKITSINARQILNSRGEPSLEVEIITDDGLLATDSVPTGTSAGNFEIVVVDPSRAVENINRIIAPKIIGLNPIDQFEIDQLLQDLNGQNDYKLGANATLGVSLVVSRVASLTQKMPLYWYLNKLYEKIYGQSVEPSIPTPMMVMIEGGKHANNNICIQEFLVIGELLHGKKIWHALNEILVQKEIPIKLGLEGGFAPKLNFDEDAIDLILAATKLAKLNVPDQIKLGLDITANHCGISLKDVLSLMDRYPIYSLEDPAPQDAWHHWAQMKLELDQKNRPYLLVGDDLFVTSSKRLEKGLNDFIANAIIIKINQNSTLTETLKLIAMAQKANYTHILSHRSGETMDSFIADLAVATAAKFLKAGAPLASEREIKYQRLVEIAKEL